MTTLTPEMEIGGEQMDYGPRVLAAAVERPRRRPIRNAVIATILCAAAGFVAGYLIGFEAGVNARDTWRIYVPNSPEPTPAPEQETYV